MKIRKCVKAAMQRLCIDELKPGQLRPVNRIIDGRDTFLIAGTSFGKSLTVHIPAVINSDKLTVIVEPLTVLMHDQVKHLQSLGISAHYLDSTQTKDERKEVRKLLKNGKVNILYVSPERLNRKRIPEEIYSNEIGMVVVDEAHCVLNWGLSFRPDYLHIGGFIDSLECRPTVVVMSASAPPEDREEIMIRLSMQDARCITASLYRSNLRFLKYACHSRTEQIKCLKKVMKKYHKYTTLVYCSTQKAVKYVSKELKKWYPGEVVAYYGDDKSGEADMLSGKKHIAVATTALAMGVNIPDVDLVIHFNMPLSIPDYYQMSGRAGQKAHSILLYNSDDYNANHYLLDHIEDANAKDIAFERLNYMREFCDDNEHCMVNMVLEALGEKRETVCRYCTNCQKNR